MNATKIEVPLIWIEDLIGCHVGIEAVLRCLHVQIAQQAVTDDEAGWLRAITEARRLNQEAHDLLVRKHPNRRCVNGKPRGIGRPVPTVRG